MKILISDYFGTIDRYGKKRNILESIDFKKDIKSINKFVNAGNKFIIYTDQPTSIIIDELKDNKIIYSYLSSFNGLITMDNKNNIIYAKYLSKNVIEYIKNYFKEYSSQIELTQCFNETGHVSLNYGKKFLKIGMDFYEEEALYDFMDEMSFIFKELEIYKKGNTVWLSNYINKEQGIEYLTDYIEELKALKDKITILGSKDTYDYSLIKTYGGYGMKDSFASKILGEDKSVSNVRRLIKKIK